MAHTAGKGGAMDDGVGGTEEAEQELLAALTPVEENKATDAENPPLQTGPPLWFESSTRYKESQSLTRARKQDNSNNLKRAEIVNLPSQLQGSISARHCGTPRELKKPATS